MAKKKMRLFEMWMWFVGIVGAIGIGGLFIAGSLTEQVILEWFPLIIHQSVGWTIVGTTIAALLDRMGMSI